VFDHVTIRVSDRTASRKFYELALSVLGHELSSSGDDYDEWNDFSIAQARDERPLTRRLHVGFVSPSIDTVDEFWRALTAAGYIDDGPPGPRPQYREEYYGAFVLDPDGNSAEAVHHGLLRDDGGVIDHLWLRVLDVAASKWFYETIASVVGIRLVSDEPRRVRFRGEHGSCTFVEDEERLTENVHLAFPADDDATVNEFHRVAVAAGYRDNGAPGERPEYHPGYYAAYVLDPDGNNVEVVHHNRRETE
jgi:catechol 2,3-dioxygenase-like lactoylglutathione lyase family enzyme